jgi:hypothetical protein
MQIQCHRCQKLALNHSESGQSTEKSERAIFADLIKGKDKGCAGCQLVCELLPLLNDYYTGLDDAGKLTVHYSRHRFAVETLIILKDGTRRLTWIGEFKLCKKNGNRYS